ncbi:Protein drumstick [Trachymyrmex zeteki]|uniref:Protein drumstick n=1 Tax=Mycetomoellerius zeteki TaxID=64791 RepID=A0A151XB01_9HYME|nr:Protein drumstick [Trachymyrmex zeteki]
MFAIMPMETEGHGREFGRRQKMRAKCTVEFVCKYCQRRFTKPYNLMIHERSHKDDVTFTCEVCGKTFKRQDNLKQHSVFFKLTRKLRRVNYRLNRSANFALLLLPTGASRRVDVSVQRVARTRGPIESA